MRFEPPTPPNNKRRQIKQKTTADPYPPLSLGISLNRRQEQKKVKIFRGTLSSPWRKKQKKTRQPQTAPRSPFHFVCAKSTRIPFNTTTRNFHTVPTPSVSLKLSGRSPAVNENAPVNFHVQDPQANLQEDALAILIELLKYLEKTFLRSRVHIECQSALVLLKFLVTKMIRTY